MQWNAPHAGLGPPGKAELLHTFCNSGLTARGFNGPNPTANLAEVVHIPTDLGGFGLGRLLGLSWHGMVIEAVASITFERPHTAVRDLDVTDLEWSSYVQYRPRAHSLSGKKARGIGSDSGRRTTRFCQVCYDPKLIG